MTGRPSAPEWTCRKSIGRRPTKIWGVVLGNGPITRQSRIGSNRASTRSRETSAGPVIVPERAAEASAGAVLSRIASRADSPARRSRGLRSWIAARYMDNARGSGSAHRASIAKARCGDLESLAIASNRGMAAPI